MRILEIVSARGINGVSKHALDVGVGLRSRGHSITFLGVADSWILESAQNQGFESIVSDMHRWPGDEIKRISGVARELGIDVAHTHMSKANFFGVMLKWYSGIPSVATAHSCHLQLHWFANSFVIAVSEATRRYHRFVNFVPKSRIRTIHNSIRFSSEKSEEQLAIQRAQMRSQLGLQSSDFVIGLVGRIAPQKGQLTMVDSLPAILSEIPNAKLLLIGGLETPDYLARIEGRLNELSLRSHVQILGLRHDVLDLLTGIDVLAQPSLWESFPISMLEGMTVGVPIVASDVGGVRECLEHDRSGYLILPKNSALLSKAIIKLAKSPELCRRLRDEAIRVVRSKFSPEMQITKTEQVLASVCARRVGQMAA
ncbi:MAG: glycosyltransferase family 4 protein [Planctomycetota bacterium]|nr:glycosyltransferase family 4 protein [Planctomycetota bacterium]